jgi:hypothetical protein
VATKKPAGKAIARGKAPSSITVRMYNVGFGDCFLLTFHYASRNRHMLIDYGSTAGPKNGPKDYMNRVADDIKDKCGDKLDIVVSTHRHRDHISGFATTGDGTGKLIASLNPDHVVQSWTEDPDAKPTEMTATASTFTNGKPDHKQLTAHFLGSLEDMHAVAGSVVQLASAGKLRAGRQTANQLSFLGEDNLKNLSAVQNLMEMGKKAKAYYVNAGMTLNDLLPGVKITVLGPPTLKQSERIRKQRAKDPNEFWQFRSFWASQYLAITGLVYALKEGVDVPFWTGLLSLYKPLFRSRLLEALRGCSSMYQLLPPRDEPVLVMETGERFSAMDPAVWRGQYERFLQDAEDSHQKMRQCAFGNFHSVYATEIPTPQDFSIDPAFEIVSARLPLTWGDGTVTVASARFALDVEKWHPVVRPIAHDCLPSNKEVWTKLRDLLARADTPGGVQSSGIGK